MKKIAFLALTVLLLAAPAAQARKSICQKGFHWVQPCPPYSNCIAGGACVRDRRPGPGSPKHPKRPHEKHP